MISVSQNTFKCGVKTPLKFNLSGTCYTGPVRQTNLALITCPDSKSIVPLEALVRCFSSEVGTFPLSQKRTEISNEFAMAGFCLESRTNDVILKKAYASFQL